MTRAARPLAVVILVAAAAATRVSAAGRLIVVVGAEGEPAFGRQFDAWADRWVAAAAGALDVRRIGRDVVATTAPAVARPAIALRPATTATQPTTAATRPAVDKDALHDALRSAAAESPGDPLWLVLIGHGTADGGGAKFNLRGPDVSDAELAEWLRPVKRPVAVIDCTSASGPFLKRLSAPGRVVVTATRGGSEYQFARFGDAVSGAIADPAADLDKDGRTSLLEAFLTASGRVDGFYKNAGRLVTEHAQLDDTGDGVGTAADAFSGVRPRRPGVTPGDGPRAHQWVLRPAAATRPLSDTARVRRDALEAAVEALRSKKPTLAEDDYYRQLERLMVELAGLEP